MKVKQRSGSDTLSKTYPGLSFYLADLRHIVEVVKARGATCRITDDTKEYDDLADLVANCPPKIVNLELSFPSAGGYSTHGWIRIRAGKTTISVFDRDESLPIWVDLSSYLDSKTGITSFVIRPVEYFCLSIMAMTSLLFLRYPYVQIALMGGFFCLCLYSILVLASARIHLEERHQIHRQMKIAIGAVALVVLGAALMPFVDWAKTLFT